MESVQRMRNVSNRNTARAVIVDILTGGDESLTENLAEALARLIAIQSHFACPQRMSFISLYVMGSCNECLLPFTSTKSNQPSALQCIKRLAGFTYNDVNVQATPYEESISCVLTEVLTAFRQHLQRANQGSCMQLDIYFITKRKKGNLEGSIARILQNCDLQAIKKLQIVHVISATCLEPDLSSSAESAGSLDSGARDLVCGYIETMSVENDTVSLEQFFKSWLRDSGTDDVQLQIKIEDSEEDGASIMLKCDIWDALIDPVSIPSGQHLVIQSDLNMARNNFGYGSQSKHASQLPVYHLTPRQLIKASMLCESVLYGLPFILKPSTCWKLDWEELEQNQLCFQNLCSFLQREELVLLLVDMDNAWQMSPHYVLLPSSGGTSMLIKSVAVRDILIPVHPGSSLEKRDDPELSRKMERALEKIPVAEGPYNPLKYDSGLLQKLTSSHIASKPASKDVQNRPVLKDNSRSSKYVPVFGSHPYRKQRLSLHAHE